MPKALPEPQTPGDPLIDGDDSLESQAVESEAVAHARALAEENERLRAQLAGLSTVPNVIKPAVVVRTPGEFEQMSWQDAKAANPGKTVLTKDGWLVATARSEG